MSMLATVSCRLSGAEVGVITDRDEGEEINPEFKGVELDEDSDHRVDAELKLDEERIGVEKVDE
jgi:hypothetical protein